MESPVDFLFSFVIIPSLTAGKQKNGCEASNLDLLDKKIDEERKIIEDAKQKGVWKGGLDSNRELFTELDAEFARKI